MPGAKNAAMSDRAGIFRKFAIVPGTMMIVWAKMIGITPAVMIRIGMKVFGALADAPAAHDLARDLHRDAPGRDRHGHHGRNDGDGDRDVENARRSGATTPPLTKLASWTVGGPEPLEDRKRDQQALAVADAALGDLLTQPHHEDGARGERHHHDMRDPNPGSANAPGIDSVKRAKV